MQVFLKSIQYVTGPLTLVAFLAVVLLAAFYRSVRDRRGLEYLHDLFSSKLSKEHFYQLAVLIIKMLFWLIVIVFSLSMAAFVLSIRPAGGGGRADGTTPGDGCVLTADMRSMQGEWHAKDPRYKEFDYLYNIRIKDCGINVDIPNAGRPGFQLRNWGTIRLDPATHPKSIDLVNWQNETPWSTQGVRGDSATVLGIYELKGGILRVCLNGSGDLRPTEFAAGKASGPTDYYPVLLEFRR